MRCLSRPTGDPHTVVPTTRRSVLVDRLNASIECYPLTVSFWYIYHRAAIIGCVWGGLTIAGVHVPHELGAAFLILGSLRNFKIPIVLAASAALVHARPELAKLRLAALLARPLEAIWEGLGGGNSRAATHPNSAGDAAVPSLSLTGRIREYALRPLQLWRRQWAAKGGTPGGNSAGSLVDRFGLAYVLAARGVAAVSLSATAAALHWGVDVSPLLEWLGVHWGDAVAGGGTGAAAGGVWAVAEGLSRWAAAGLALNLAYPWVLRWSVAELALAAGPWWAGGERRGVSGGEREVDSHSVCAGLSLGLRPSSDYARRHCRRLRRLDNRRRLRRNRVNRLSTRTSQLPVTRRALMTAHFLSSERVNVSDAQPEPGSDPARQAQADRARNVPASVSPSSSLLQDSDSTPLANKSDLPVK